METAKVKLGKIGVTVHGEYNKEIEYDVLSIVNYKYTVNHTRIENKEGSEDENDDEKKKELKVSVEVLGAFISKQPVPKGEHPIIKKKVKEDQPEQDVVNEEYWLLLSQFNIADSYEEWYKDINEHISILRDHVDKEVGKVKTEVEEDVTNKLDAKLSYTGEITPTNFKDIVLGGANTGNVFYIFSNIVDGEHTYTGDSSEDYPYYNQRGIAIRSSELRDNGRFIIPANCRDKFKYHAFKEDFDWLLESGDVLIRTGEYWDIVPAKGKQQNGQGEGDGSGGGTYPLVEVSINDDGTVSIEDDRYFEIGTETVAVNGVHYYPDNGYNYIREDENDAIASGIKFDETLNINSDDTIKINAKLI